jgi:hypothetical protein
LNFVLVRIAHVGISLVHIFPLTTAQMMALCSGREAPPRSTRSVSVSSSGEAV